MATMPTEPANLNPPVTPWGQALTMKELQVFRPVSVIMLLRPCLWIRQLLQSFHGTPTYTCMTQEYGTFIYSHFVTPRRILRPPT